MHDQPGPQSIKSLHTQVELQSQEKYWRCDRFMRIDGLTSEQQFIAVVKNATNANEAYSWRKISDKTCRSEPNMDEGISRFTFPDLGCYKYFCLAVCRQVCRAFLFLTNEVCRTLKIGKSR